MKNQKKLLLIICILIVVGVTVFCIINFNVQRNLDSDMLTEYVPQEEISDEQMKETKVILYFLNSDTKELKSEGRLMNVNELIQNPYKRIVELLIEGPDSSSLINVFPENTRILDAKIENGLVTLNFSEELINYKDDVQKYNIINSILNSLTGLNEVDGIKILVNNKVNKNLDEEFKAIY